jgi:hypothetical protein
MAWPCPVPICHGPALSTPSMLYPSLAFSLYAMDRPCRLPLCVGRIILVCRPRARHVVVGPALPSPSMLWPGRALSHHAVAWSCLLALWHARPRLLPPYYGPALSTPSTLWTCIAFSLYDMDHPDRAHPTHAMAWSRPLNPRHGLAAPARPTLWSGHTHSIHAMAWPRPLNPRHGLTTPSLHDMALPRPIDPC